MDVRVSGRSFDYVVAPEIYYTHVLVWISMSRFVQAFFTACSCTGQLQFVLEALNTFSEFDPSKGHRANKYYA